MTVALAGTFADVAAGLAFAALLVPLALAARRLGADRLDAPRAAAAGVAFAAVALVVAGLVLSAIGAAGDAAGWLVALLVADAALLIGAPDRLTLAWRALPALLAAGALGLTAGALALSHASAEDAERESSFTQLWMLPRGEGDVAEVGVRNEEGVAATYRLRIAPDAGGAPLLDRTILLGESRTWTATVALPPVLRPERVSAELYRPGDSDPYRRAHVWTPTGR